MLNKHEITHLFQWYADMGLDEAISHEPTDWTQFRAAAPVAAAPAAVSLQKSPAAPAAKAPAAAVLDGATLAQARKLADSATDLAMLEAAVRGFDGCSLKKMAKNTVFCDGNPLADIMFIGEAPGADEDQRGIPFCGASGQLLNEMLGHIGLIREKNYYISNTLFWRPPGNRTPSAEELALCQPFVEKHIALVKPKLLVFLGGTAAHSLLKNTMPVSKLRLETHHYTNPYLAASIPVRVFFHPSNLLRQPLQKKLAWDDALAMRSFARDELDVHW